MHQHEDETDHGYESQSTSKSHVLMMALCCILPLVAIASLLAIFPGSPYLLFPAVLLCPLSMSLMMLPDWLHRKKEAVEKHGHASQ
ncbi:MAG: hypothetical protein ABSF24_08745 [Candidatus Bathyarchaeia archaeon]|jgi:hypothetical protein